MIYGTARGWIHAKDGIQTPLTRPGPADAKAHGGPPDRLESKPGAPPKKPRHLLAPDPAGISETCRHETGDQG
ncbi:MAG: hypothetical protein JWM59_1012 [Verrucomicrobiales bacterium]|nr:hypothetical protein [Verrucomicrobiales bacterium]